MSLNDKIIPIVAEIYKEIDSCNSENPNNCRACGKCCDFQSYDHRLFITTPELIYFKEGIKPEKIKPMFNGKCPYNINQKCSVYQHRFAGCRIFSCKGDEDFQSRLTESTIQKFKNLCKKFDLPYRYTDLATALSP